MLHYRTKLFCHSEQDNRSHGNESGDKINRLNSRRKNPALSGILFENPITRSVFLLMASDQFFAGL